MTVTVTDIVFVLNRVGFRIWSGRMIANGFDSKVVSFMASIRRLPARAEYLRSDTFQVVMHAYHSGRLSKTLMLHGNSNGN